MNHLAVYKSLVLVLVLVSSMNMYRYYVHIVTNITMINSVIPFRNYMLCVKLNYVLTIVKHL